MNININISIDIDIDINITHKPLRLPNILGHEARIFKNKFKFPQKNSKKKGTQLFPWGSKYFNFSTFFESW